MSFANSSSTREHKKTEHIKQHTAQWEKQGGFRSRLGLRNGRFYSKTMWMWIRSGPKLLLIFVVPYLSESHQTYIFIVVLWSKVLPLSWLSIFSCKLPGLLAACVCSTFHVQYVRHCIDEQTRIVYDVLYLNLPAAHPCVSVRLSDHREKPNAIKRYAVCRYASFSTPPV